MRPEAALLVAAALLGGCALRPVGAQPGAALPLPPGSFGGSRSAAQVLHAAYGERQATLQSVVQIEPGLIRVTGLTAMGQRVFDVRYDGRSLVAERSPFAPDALKPEALLADLQLAFWPLPVLQAGAAPGTEISEPQSGVRRLLRNGVIAAEVHYADADPWNGRLWLVSLEHGYSLDIRSRPLEPSS